MAYRESPEVVNQQAHELTIQDELTEFLLYTTPDGKVKVEIFFS